MNRNELKQIASNIHSSKGDAIQGERIIAQAREIGRIRVVPGTSTHQMQQAVLKCNALCVIDREFRVKDKKLKLK